MDTFCGCDTETLDDLAERVREGALRLIQLIEHLVGKEQSKNAWAAFAYDPIKTACT